MSFISPFTHVLQTNFVPSAIEIDAIKSILPGPSSELLALDDELKQLQEQLAAKTEAKDSLVKSIDEHLNLLSPFRCLPDEILAEIFTCCLPTSYGAILHHEEPPLLLGYVCRRWRTVAYHTPRLWRTLHIVIPKAPQFYETAQPDTVKCLTSTFERNLREHQDGIMTWLSRSKACLLSISMHDMNSSWFSDAPALPYFNNLYGVAHRIVHLQINVNQKKTSDYLITLPSSLFPALRILSIKFNKDLRNHHSTPGWDNSGILQAPNLVHLSMLRFPLALPRINVNWTSLTDVVATGSEDKHKFDIHDALTIFTNCPMLRFCDIDISPSSSTPAYVPFRLKYLHTLSIVSGCAQLRDLFQYADIPSLRYLKFYSTVSPSHDRRLTLLVILSRPNLQLESLDTDIRFFTLSDLIECFELVPSLIHFQQGPAEWTSTILGYRIPAAPKILSALLDILTPAQDRPLYLPKLRSFHLNLARSEMCVTNKEIVNFVRGRMSSAASGSGIQVTAALKVVSFLSLTGEDRMNIFSELADYIASGNLHLKLSYIDTDDSLFDSTLNSRHIHHQDSPFSFYYPRSRQAVPGAEYL